MHSVKLLIVAALGLGVSACATGPSYRDGMVYEDGSYYAPAAAGRGDYYVGVAPMRSPYDDPFFHPYFDPFYGPWRDPWLFGYSGHCSVRYRWCPTWSSGFYDPFSRFDLWISSGYGYYGGYGYGGYGGYYGYGGWPHTWGGWHRTPRRDRDRDRDRDEGTGVPPPRPEGDWPEPREHADRGADEAQEWSRDEWLRRRPPPPPQVWNGDRREASDRPARPAPRPAPPARQVERRPERVERDSSSEGGSSRGGAKLRARTRED